MLRPGHRNPDSCSGPKHPLMGSKGKWVGLRDRGRERNGGKERKKQAETGQRGEALAQASDDKVAF